MSTTFFVSDTHFGHQNILEYMPQRKTLGATLEEHNESLVENWNSVVSVSDTVWHLGDVVFGPATNHTYVGRLKGIKKLVMGNHDRLKYIGHYFADVFGVFYWKGEGVLSHVPLHECQVGQSKRFKYNLHGHLHGIEVQSIESSLSYTKDPNGEYLEDYTTWPNPMYYNCCIDNIGFFPKPWDEIKSDLRNRGVL